jgi:transposase
MQSSARSIPESDRQIALGPYVKAQKNDDRDAEAIAQAATRPTMRFAELKSDEQLDMQTLHRARDRLVGERTALTNQLRAILLERGIVIAQGRSTSNGRSMRCGPKRTAYLQLAAPHAGRRHYGKYGGPSIGVSPPSI